MKPVKDDLTAPTCKISDVGGCPFEVSHTGC